MKLTFLRPLVHSSVTARHRIVILFQIKICGITSVKDARFASLAGADAVGLNFYSQSPRYLELATAEAILAGIPKTVVKVGVFVNASADQMIATADQLGLDFIQLHGDEPPEVLGELAPRQVIRAFRCGDDGFTPIVSYLATCLTQGQVPAAVLLDAHQPGEYGGTGQVIDWSSVAANRQILGTTPVILAGGLTPYNVGEAIHTARPDAVDAASGVESAPGIKDLLQLRAFCSTAKKAFAS